MIAVDAGTEGGIVGANMLPDILAGAVSTEPRAQLTGIFPKLAEGLKAVTVMSLSLGCDRFPHLSDVDRILERGGVWVRQLGYRKIFELAEPKVFGDALFLECRVYLVNGFDSQNETIGTAVGRFFKEAEERDVPQQKHWSEQGYEILHYMAAGKCPKNAKFIILATLVRKKPKH